MRRAFEAYIVQKREAHYRLAYSYTKHAEDAWDVLQSAIEKGLKQLGTLSNPDALNSWFYSILVHTALDFLRRNQRYVYMPPEALYDRVETWDTYADEDLSRALDILPTEVKTIIVLRFFEALKLSEIAVVLGISENTVKSRLYRGLKLLRIELEDTDDSTKE